MKEQIRSESLLLLLYNRLWCGKQLAVAVVQLVEQLFPTVEVSGSNPFFVKIILFLCKIWLSDQPTTNAINAFSG